MNEQSIGLTGVKNARELGGYAAADGRRVKRGKLLRTASLSRATKEDIRLLAEKYRISVIVDFRMDMEAEPEPDPEIGDAEYHRIAVMNQAELEKLNANMAEMWELRETDFVRFLREALAMGIVSENMYIDFLDSECGREGFARFLRFVIDTPADHAVLWHCTSGKDRTGVAALLLLAVLGVDEKTALYDFTLTNEFNAKSIAASRALLEENGITGDELDSMITILDGVKLQYMENAVAWMKKKYGSVTGYVTDVLHVSAEDIELLREKYLGNR